MVQVRAAERALEEAVGERVVARHLPHGRAAAVVVPHHQAARVAPGGELVVQAAVDLHLVLVEPVVKVAGDDGVGERRRAPGRRRRVDLERRVGQHVGGLGLRDRDGLAGRGEAAPGRRQLGEHAAVAIALRRVARRPLPARAGRGHARGAGETGEQVVEAAVLGVDHDHVGDAIEREAAGQRGGEILLAAGVGDGGGDAVDHGLLFGHERGAALVRRTGVRNGIGHAQPRPQLRVGGGQRGLAAGRVDDGLQLGGQRPDTRGSRIGALGTSQHERPRHGHPRVRRLVDQERALADFRDDRAAAGQPESAVRAREHRRLAGVAARVAVAVDADPGVRVDLAVDAPHHAGDGRRLGRGGHGGKKGGRDERGGQRVELRMSGHGSSRGRR